MTVAEDKKEGHDKPVMVEENIDETMKRAQLDNIKASTALLAAQTEDVLNKAVSLTDAEVSILVKLRELSRRLPKSIGLAINGTDYDNTIIWEDIHALDR